MTRAKIFRTENTQFVALPKEFRFADDADEVSIRREAGKIILEPVPTNSNDWPAEFWTAFEGMPEGFERPTQSP